MREITGFFRIYEENIITLAKKYFEEKTKYSDGAVFTFGLLEASISLYLVQQFFACNYPPDEYKCEAIRQAVEKVGDLKDYLSLYETDKDVRKSLDIEADYLFRLENNPPYIFVRCERY